MTHHHQASSFLLSSLGSVLPHFSMHRSGSSLSLKRHPALQEFENRLSEKLEASKMAGEELGFLSIDWFLQSMTVVLATYSNVQALIPNLPVSETRDDKWVDECLDDSAKLLDVCNVLKEGISDVEHYQTLVQLALLNLDNNESFSEAKYHRARNAFQDCKEAIQKKDTVYRQGQPKSKLESCSSMLRTMGEKLVNPKGVNAAKGNGFLNAIYGAKVTTIFLCGLLVIALACKPKRPLVNLSLTSPQTYLWSSSLVSLQHRVKEQTDKRKNGGSIALLCELDNVDSSVRKLHQLLDDHGSNLSEKKCHFQSVQMRQLVEDLRKSSRHLGSSLGPLEQCVNELFRILINSRLALLDTLSNSQ